MGGGEEAPTTVIGVPASNPATGSERVGASAAGLSIVRVAGTTSFNPRSKRSFADTENGAVSRVAKAASVTEAVGVKREITPPIYLCLH